MKKADRPKAIRFFFICTTGAFPEGKVAGVTGLEPATSGVTGRHSNQLSYTPASGEGAYVPTPPYRCKHFFPLRKGFFPLPRKAARIRGLSRP